MVGDGDDPTLEAMTHPDDRSEIGWVEDSRIPGILDRFDLLVLPYIEASQWERSHTLPGVVFRWS